MVQLVMTRETKFCGLMVVGLLGLLVLIKAISEACHEEPVRYVPYFWCQRCGADLTMLVDHNPWGYVRPAERSLTVEGGDRVYMVDWTWWVYYCPACKRALTVKWDHLYDRPGNARGAPQMERRVPTRW